MGGLGEGSAGRGAWLPPGRPSDGFLVCVSGQFARNFWDHGNSIRFRELQSEVTWVYSPMGAGSRDRTCDDFLINLLELLQG